MEGIVNVVQEPGFVRIELDDGFYIILNEGGAIVGRSPSESEREYLAEREVSLELDHHAHLDGEAADQIARTIMSWQPG